MIDAKLCPLCGAPWDIHVVAGDPCILIGDDEENVMEPFTGNGIGWAVKELLNGNLVRRAGWDGKSMYLLYVPGSKFVVNRAPMNVIYPEGTEVEYHGHVDMKTAQGYIIPWLCSQADLLAVDWELAKLPE